MPSDSQVRLVNTSHGFLEFADSIRYTRAMMERIADLLPKRGGTHLYCTWNKEDQGSVTVCLWRHKIHPNGYARYRRHYRRNHGEF